MINNNGNDFKIKTFNDEIRTLVNLAESHCNSYNRRTVMADMQVSSS